MKKAIVVVDMQKDFIDGALGTKEAQAMLPRMEAKLAAARAAGWFQNKRAVAYVKSDT